MTPGSTTEGVGETEASTSRAANADWQVPMQVGFAWGTGCASRALSSADQPLEGLCHLSPTPRRFMHPHGVPGRIEMPAFADAVQGVGLLDQ